MTPFVSDPDLTIFVGDALDVLRSLPDASVNCCVTSPPYWGLRDYGHDGQLGLEGTPDEYVAALVAVFREVRRVLADDGTLFLNLGDSYASGGGLGAQGEKGQMADRGIVKARRLGRNDAGRNFTGGGGNREGSGNPGQQGLVSVAHGLKPKDLVGIPWRVAFALQADGWYLRSDIVWAKPNPMPESVTDRPTKAHEMVFLLAKGQWKARVVALADLNGQRVHLGDHVGAKGADVWAHEFGVRLATTILDRAQREDQLGLPPLDAKVWQQLPDDRDGFRVAGLPVEHRAAVYAARLLSANAPAKEFLCELDRLGVALAERDEFLVGGSATRPFTLPPGVNRYGETAIAIHDTGEIGELDFSSHSLKFSRPSGCSYFYDADALREPSDGPDRGPGMTRGVTGPHAEQAGLDRRARRTAALAGPTWEEREAAGAKRANRDPENVDARAVHMPGQSHTLGDGLTRNGRSVWTIATQPYAEAHFAVFPEELPRRCILAGCPEWVCSVCRKPRERLTERTAMVVRRSERTHEKGRTRSSGTMLEPPTSETVGWSDCGHGAYVPGTVLDPFFGSGTTGLVARTHGRRCTGIELNPEYARLAAQRCQQLSLFAEATP